MATRLLIYAFAKRWTWLIVGVIALLAGGAFFATAHAAVPVEVSGTLSDVTAVSQNGVYDHTELKLAGDSNTYTYDENQMSPSGIKDNYYRDGKVDLWIDQGTTNVLAIQLYGQDDNTPTKYVTDY